MVFVLAPQISSLRYNTNITILTHEEWLRATLEGMKIIVFSPSFQLSFIRLAQN